VPSTTTVIGRFKESGGLIHWAWDLGTKGEDYRKVRDAAGDAGTLAHSMIEAHIRGEDPSKIEGPEELLALARQGFEGFTNWFESTKLEIITSEISLVSDELRFGGTLDAIGVINGKLALIDWKTSNRIYQDYIIQVSAYRHLWETGRLNINMPDKEVPRMGDTIEELHLLRFGKEYGDFHHHSWPLVVLDKGWQAFRLMRELYDLDKVLKKAVG
jgi:hypothetical protein